MKRERAEVKIKHLQEFVDLSLYVKDVNRMKDQIEARIKDTIIENFIELSDGELPIPIDAYEYKANATIECKKRSIASELTDVDMEILEKHGVIVEPTTISSQKFIINPEYMSNSDMLEKVAKLLMSTEIPKDFIQIKPAVKKYIVTDDLFEKCFKERRPAPVIKVISSIGIRVKAKVLDFTKISERIKKVLMKA